MSKTVNALTLRQHFGRVLKDLELANEPIVVEKGKKPVAVLISIELFKKRFLDFQDLEAQRTLYLEFVKSSPKPKQDSLKTLRDLRYG
jgi:PHD/YefM family antitoxin component YafN of YafNO toxin-antitoxin module